jgi:hypothetical protein
MLATKRLSWASGLLVLVLTLPGIAHSQEIARVKSVSGEASVQRGAEQLRAKPGDPLYESDVVKTGADGSLGLAFVDNTVFTAGPNSELALKHFRFDKQSSTGEMLADIKHGTLSVVSGAMVKGSPGAMKIKTPTAVLNVRGTTFLVKID